MDACLWQVGGVALLIDRALTPQQRDAVLETLAYAQCRADSQGPRFARFKRWHDDFRSELSASGWIVTGTYRDSSPGRSRSLLAPAQPLQLWLSQRCPGAAATLAAAVDTLAGAAPAERMRTHVQRLDSDGTHAVHSLGLVGPGLQLELCAIALQTSGERADLASQLSAEQLLGEVMVRGLTAVFSPVLHGARQALVRSALEKAGAMTEHFSVLGEITPGGQCG